MVKPAASKFHFQKQLLSLCHSSCMYTLMESNMRPIYTADYTAVDIALHPKHNPPSPPNATSIHPPQPTYFLNHSTLHTVVHATRLTGLPRRGFLHMSPSNGTGNNTPASSTPLSSTFTSNASTEDETVDDRRATNITTASHHGGSVKGLCTFSYGHGATVQLWGTGLWNRNTHLPSKQPATKLHTTLTY
ncbi:uncharacterized protein HKW66_Vig0229770 [Vigna angularis]|uniref:Uncharacterized protein n=1 Tax=Phaseolus angularis TaxID=3914 RepID=A0A8T0KCW7_PHAAN|nr:uncharacterized protein HKW66_Vig0229770 [Vigna angularis]